MANFVGATLSLGAMVGGRSLRKGAVWAIIIGGHVLLLILFSRGSSRHVLTAESRPEDRSVLFFPELPEPIEEPAAPQEQPQQSIARPAPDRSPSDTAITLPPETPAARAPIDWYAEAERVARVTAEREGQPKPRAFGEIPKSPYTVCKKKKSSFQWDPEPKAAGLMGIFPYVRLGKRCMVSIGFFGCILDELPPPNSHLFDDMHDVNRPTSSVPLFDECD
jgi:hypothetical protein